MLQRPVVCSFSDSNDWNVSNSRMCAHEVLGCWTPVVPVTAYSTKAGRVENRSKETLVYAFFGSKD